jgi:hypothetical protein
MTQAQTQRNFVLTDRDLAMLATIGAAGYVTPAVLEWLHYPNRREHWAQALTTPGRYKLTAALYRRLVWFRKAEYVHRLVRTAPLGAATVGRCDDIYMLTDLGARKVSSKLEIPLSELVYTRERPRSVNMLTHYAATAEVYAALRSKIESMPTVTMEKWLSEHRTARAFDQLMVRVRTSKGSMEMQRLPVQPDGTFELRHGQGATRIFLEVDRGTRRVDTWAEKMAAYQAYLGSRELRDRYGVENFLLLVVAWDEAQCQRLMETTARVVRGPMPHIYFTLASSVHPLTIGAGWRVVTDVQLVRQIGVAGRSYDQAIIQTEPHVLLK